MTQSTPAPASTAQSSNAQSSKDRPHLRLKPGKDKRLRQGHPWIFANEVEMDAETKDLPPGCLVRVVSQQGKALGTAIFNRKPLIAGRLISRNPTARIDAGFFVRRLSVARELRDRLIGEPFYRLAHAESDGLPGTVIDRFADALVLQVNTAGMEALMTPLLEALDEVVSPSRILLRNDSPARALEGLESQVNVLRGDFAEPLQVRENGALYLADPASGQKTGWFYDQRDNRDWLARLSGGARVLDLCSYTGGFSILAALRGATEVTAVDRSEVALSLVDAAARLNGVDDRVATRRAEVFEEAQRLQDSGERFDVVVADPPAFVKSKKDLAQGLKGYRKLFRLASRLVKPGGVFFAASCSHHVDDLEFDRQLRKSLADNGRSGRVLRASGAGADHPVHVFLPESAYLKGRLLLLD